MSLCMGVVGTRADSRKGVSGRRCGTSRGVHAAARAAKGDGYSYAVGGVSAERGWRGHLCAAGRKEEVSGCLPFALAQRALVIVLRRARSSNGRRRFRWRLARWENIL